MIEFETSVVDVIKRAPGVKSFRFKAGNELNFKAGQFFFVTVKSDSAEMTKHFSFSNSPTEKGYVEFTKRITESPYSKALESLKTGDWARLKMPLGSFTLRNEREKIAFLSGGIGITPIRSMCKFATDKGFATDIVLIYGNSTEKDIIFRDDFDRMASANKNLRVIYTLTNEATDENLWRGRTGYIDERMIREEIPDYSERIFYICGPPKMVQALAGILKNGLKIPDDRTVLENFTGYQ